MAKMIVEIVGANKETLQTLMGNEMQKKFNKVPMVKDIVKIRYED